MLRRRARARAVGLRTGPPVPLWLCLSLAACQLSGPAPAGPSEISLPGPVLAPGSITRAEQAEAVQLFQSAERSFEARRFAEVLRTTADLMERLPASDVSGAALLLSARAELALGEVERADAAAERYVALLQPEDPRATEARLLQVQAAEGDPSTRLDRLLRIVVPAEPSDVTPLIPLTREAADSLQPAELEAVLAGAPPGGALAPIAQVRHAVNLLDAGDEQAGADLAQAALTAGLPEPEREIAEGVVRGELPEGRRRVRDFEIATVLPAGGPPALAEFARLVGEGVEVAAATVLGDDYEVTLTPRDDEGDPALTAGWVTELESRRVAGAVGFLEDEALEAAGQARSVGLPIVSPTARNAASVGAGVYSLEGADLEAAATMARYAASRAFQRVAVVLPDSPPAMEEADAFELEAATFGVPVVGRFVYPPGAAFFESQMLGARDSLRAAEVAALGLTANDTLRVEMLEPVAIFFPIPPEDVEYIAPQIAHFALDTLAIEVIGTSGWTDPQVLAAVETRYTSGVVATVPSGTGALSPGSVRFRTAYEEYFQRSLVSPTPALGYDAALLLLEALRPGRPAPADVWRSFQDLRDVEGATGIFSVIDDRVVRRTQLVLIENGSLSPISLD